jgi:hypothetical protein
MNKARQALASLLEPNKGSRKKLVILIILIVLILLAILVGLIIFNRLETKAIKDHPLVLLQSPENRSQVNLGEEVSLHATARSKNGIARIELWVDDSLVIAQDTPEDEILSPAVLHNYWEPVTAGPHTLVVQAISTSGVRGQATVTIYAQEGMAAETEAETALEPAAGSAEEGTESEESPEAGGPAPSPGGDPPGSGDDVRDYLADESSEAEPEDEPVPSAEGGEPIALKVEILALETMESYADLHCYVSFGESGVAPSQWYPDFDDDPSSDDSFPSSDGRHWDVEPYLAGDALPTIIWPEDQPLGINTTCVGIADDGMDAPELGRVNLIRVPATWDNITRRVLSEGGEGSYMIDYRISREGETPEDEEGVYKILDPDMTSPTNLHVQNWANPFGEIVGQSLTWDYEPEDDELPIDGYAIYLNETMQWLVPVERQYSDIPSQWFRPPCGETYTFAVTAYRGPDPVTGFESYPSEGLSFYTADIGDPICEQTYLLTFHTMTTGELHEGRLYDGMVGGFYVNDEMVTFNGRCDESGVYGVVGLYENYEYDLPSTADYLGDGPTQFLITRGEDLTLSYGFLILSTYTTGLGSTSTTRFCYNDGTIAWIDLVGMIDPIYEHTIPSWGPQPGFCEVFMTIEPVSSGPSAAPGAPLPLPYLTVEELSVDDTGWLQIEIRNEGNADWTHNIPFSLTKNSGEPIGSYTWPNNTTIAPGERYTLEYDMSDAYQPMDVCVILDPENVSPEQDDRFASPREPYCHPLPDLEIFSVSYNSDFNVLALQLSDNGGTQEHTDLSVQVDVPGFRPYSILHPDITIHGYGSNYVDVPGISDEMRSAMMDGYTVTIDPTDYITETNEENNVYSVGPGATLRLHWYAVNTYYYRYYRYSNRTQQQQFHLTVTKGPMEPISSESSFGTTTIADWSTSWFDLDREVESGPWEGEIIGEQQHNLNQWTEFTIAGDEFLYVRASGRLEYRSYPRESLGAGARSFAPGYWGVGRTISADQDCYYVGMGPPFSNNRQRLSVLPPYPWTYSGTWRVTFYICRVE